MFLMFYNSGVQTVARVPLVVLAIVHVVFTFNLFQLEMISFMA